MSSKTSSNHNRVNSHHHPSHGHAKKLSGSSHHLPAPHHHQQHQHPAPHHQQPHSQHPPAGVRSVRPMHPAETVRGGAEDKMRMAGSSRPHREEKVSFFTELFEVKYSLEPLLVEAVCGRF